MESIVDLPMMIPHPVIGIAILGLVGKNHWIGRCLHSLGIRIMGSVTGIVIVLIFVGLPFYINTVKTGFEAIPVRLEHVSRSLGASFIATFFGSPFRWPGVPCLPVLLCVRRALSASSGQWSSSRTIR